jgi:hypothetical protein
MGQGLDGELSIALGLREAVSPEIVENQPMPSESRELVMPEIRAESRPMDEYSSTARLGPHLFDEQPGAVR